MSARARGARLLTRPGRLQVWDYAIYVVIVLLTLAAFAAYGDDATVGSSVQVGVVRMAVRRLLRFNASCMLRLYVYVKKLRMCYAHDFFGIERA